MHWKNTETLKRFGLHFHHVSAEKVLKRGKDSLLQLLQNKEQSSFKPTFNKKSKSLAEQRCEVKVREN